MDGLQGVEQLPQEMIESEFNKNLVELRIKGLNGRNYRWIQRIIVKWM